MYSYTFNFFPFLDPNALLSGHILSGAAEADIVRQAHSRNR